MTDDYQQTEYDAALERAEMPEVRSMLEEQYRRFRSASLAFQARTAEGCRSARAAAFQRLQRIVDTVHEMDEVPAEAPELGGGVVAPPPPPPDPAPESPPPDPVPEGYAAQAGDQQGQG